MAGNTTEQRIGAQTEAANKVRHKEGEFRAEIGRVVNAHQELHTGYLGHAADRLAQLVQQWSDDAHHLIDEFEGFASRLVETDRLTASSQEEAGSTFTRAQSTFRTSI
jgi:hypothetical protein